MKFRDNSKIGTFLRSLLATNPNHAVPVKHHAAVTDPKELGAMLRAIDGYTGQPETAAALKLAPLVIVRPGELRAAQWHEFDLDGATWRLPAGRMKMRQDHMVPLARLPGLHL